MNIDQNRSWESCTAFTVPGFSGTKRLLTHQEQVLASAWSPSISDTTVTNIENGTSLPSTGYCNSNSGSGLTYDNNSTPADLETLPGTNAGGIRSVRTGSNSTRNCISRYGAQDMVGNVWQWSSDQLGVCDSIAHTCLGASSALDTSNTDWSGFNFDGSIGPGGGSSNVTEWDLSAMSFSATQIQLPLGLAVTGSAPSSWDATPIGVGAGQIDPAKLHGDCLKLYTDNAGASRGAFGGGAWNNGTNSGRFALLLVFAPSFSAYGFGPRCALPAE